MQAPNYKQSMSLPNCCDTCAFADPSLNLCKRYDFKYNPTYLCDSFSTNDLSLSNIKYSAQQPFQPPQPMAAPLASASLQPQNQPPQPPQNTPGFKPSIVAQIAQEKGGDQAILQSIKNMFTQPPPQQSQQPPPPPQAKQSQDKHYFKRILNLTKSSFLLPSWGGGMAHMGSGKGLGANLGYTHLLGLLPFPYANLRVGNKHLGLSAGTNLGLDTGVKPGLQWTYPRSLWGLLFDKLRKAKDPYQNSPRLSSQERVLLSKVMEKLDTSDKNKIESKLKGPTISVNL